MALFRNVNTTFWTDTKIVDDYTPEDRYFMLYALTNQYTNIIGCYEISIKQMSRDLGYLPDVIESLLKRFSSVHKTIFYNFETKELLVRNWSKYNWSNSPKLDTALLKALEKVKCDEFYDELVDVYNSRETVEEKIPYRYGIEKKAYPIDTTITNTISIPNTNTNANANASNSEPIEEKLNRVEIPYQAIVDYLNIRTGSHYKATTKKTKDLIKARFNEGFTFEDFKTVIDKKCVDWLKDKNMNMYLRPETLFGTKFESYLNQQQRALTTADLNIDLSSVRKQMWGN